MNTRKHIKLSILFGVVLVVTLGLAALSYVLLISTHEPSSLASSVSETATATLPTPAVPETPSTGAGTPQPVYPPVVAPSAVLGIVGNPANPHQFPGVPWVRLGMPSCAGGNLKGDVLKRTVQSYHNLHVRVLLSICQWATGADLFNPSILKDGAQAGPDAVQCGNEQMKSGIYNVYVPPDIFARFFDLCVQVMHAVRPDIPVILGANDPQVGGVDYQGLYRQVAYLNAMQSAMNSSVHPGGHWSWRAQTIGLIDSWHNGYPSQSVNSLYYLFVFWAQQFGVDLNSGVLGNHLWVIEGTGCINGCGIDASSPYQVAVSHILTLITDVQTTLQYHVPFFYFSGADFSINGVLWPMGVLDINGYAKPLREDLTMGAKTLTMACPTGSTIAVNQEQLLANLYNHCTLPSDYISILTS